MLATRTFPKQRIKCVFFDVGCNITEPRLRLPLMPWCQIGISFDNMVVPFEILSVGKMQSVNSQPTLTSSTSLPVISFQHDNIYWRGGNMLMINSVTNKCLSVLSSPKRIFVEGHWCSCSREDSYIPLLLHEPPRRFSLKSLHFNYVALSE